MEDARRELTKIILERGRGLAAANDEGAMG
jgi:hypothetical protein